MVTVIDVVKRQNSEGEFFNSLVISGGVEMIQSTKTNRFYATSRRTSIPSTFEDEFARTLIGQKIPGKIVRKECEDYQFTIPETDEVITLAHTYEYVPESDLVHEGAVVH